MEVHHIGSVVESIEKSLGFYIDSLNYTLESDVVKDDIQQSYLQLLKSSDGCVVELIQPYNEKSPVYPLLKKRSGPVHICYAVDSLEESISLLRQQGCIPVSKSVPAVLFNNRLVAFMMSPQCEIFELVEK